MGDVPNADTYGERLFAPGCVADDFLNQRFVRPRASNGLSAVEQHLRDVRIRHEEQLNDEFRRAFNNAQPWQREVLENALLHLFEMTDGLPPTSLSRSACLNALDVLKDMGVTP